jgi:hypothetical protein
MTTIRLMAASGDHVDATKVAHEFDIEDDPPADCIIVWGPTGQHYVYNDAGDDENGHWEEWIPATLVQINPSVGGGESS